MDRDMQEILAAVSAGKLTPDEAEAAIAALEAAQGEPAPAEDPMPQDQPPLLTSSRPLARRRTPTGRTPPPAARRGPRAPARRAGRSRSGCRTARIA